MGLGSGGCWEVVVEGARWIFGSWVWADRCEVLTGGVSGEMIGGGVGRRRSYPQPEAGATRDGGR